ncbi:hypothetical protein ACRAKI_32695 [Saccharothrix isguenensis]
MAGTKSGSGQQVWSPGDFAELRPDLVVLTGDLNSRPPTYPRTTARTHAPSGRPSAGGGGAHECTRAATETPSSAGKSTSIVPGGQADDGGG